MTPGGRNVPAQTLAMLEASCALLAEQEKEGRQRRQATMIVSAFQNQTRPVGFAPTSDTG